jgi:hypothetical protein
MDEKVERGDLKVSFLFARIIEATGWTIRGSNTDRGRNISVLQNAQTSSGAQQRFHSVGTGVLYL